MRRPGRRSWGPAAHKYHAKATQVDGIRFPSKLEAARFTELKAMQAAGIVDWFIRQPSFDLGGGVRYVADFLVVWTHPPIGAACNFHMKPITVEDCKGVQTEGFKIKKRLMAARYPLVHLKLLTAKDVRT